MKKIIGILLGMMMLMSISAMAYSHGGRGGFGGGKVTICHNEDTIDVNAWTLKTHMRHGDRKGPCETEPTEVPEEPEENEKPKGCPYNNKFGKWFEKWDCKAGGCGHKFPRMNTPNLRLVQKDPVTWDIIPDGAKGVLKGYRGKYFSANAHKLEKNTDYTLIYYGDETHNDVWPYATCIKSGKSTSRGRLRLSGAYNYAPMIDDGIAQKFWIVPSSDVDCAAKKLTAWNPANYLFEIKTI